MKHFSYLSKNKIEDIFYKAPSSFTVDSKKEVLENALGATLYMPATRASIAEIVLSKKLIGLTSLVFCLEDAIGDSQVEEAEENLLRNLKEIYITIEDSAKNNLPLMFIRVRDAEHLLKLKAKFGKYLDIISGFTLPKFNSENAVEYLENIIAISDKKYFYAMPILETENVIVKTKRYSELDSLLTTMLKYKERILNIRIGATDLCGLFGLRRNYDTTIYNIEVIRDFLGDIINIFKREEFIISGVVWEYFNTHDVNNRVLKPQLRQTPFRENLGEKGLEVRKQLLNDYTDTLLREVVMDKVNGFHGKTIIHPSHIIPVNAMYVVTHEEYTDAVEIINNNNGKAGVLKSEYSNKMNEIKPHLKWAKDILKRAEIYGVFNKYENYTKLFI